VQKGNLSLGGNAGKSRERLISIWEGREELCSFQIRKGATGKKKGTSIFYGGKNPSSHPDRIALCWGGGDFCNAERGGEKNREMSNHQGKEHQKGERGASMMNISGWRRSIPSVV